MVKNIFKSTNLEKKKTLNTKSHFYDFQKPS